MEEWKDVRGFKGLYMVLEHREQQKQKEEILRLGKLTVGNLRY